jgi:ElaB/YqjD/DUF883 family membrane-anchored ribosome-binding protein
MQDFESEVKKAEELEQGLVPVTPEEPQGTSRYLDDEFLGDLKHQAQEYGQKLQDAATRAGEKFKELQNKDPKEIIEDAKEYARQKPGQMILISAAVGLVLGFLLKGRR